MASVSEGRIGLLDTGPLISFLAAGLEYHAWAVEQWKELRPPRLTCEPVLTEAAFLLKREGGDPDALFALLASVPKPAYVLGRRLSRHAL